MEGNKNPKVAAPLREASDEFVAEMRKKCVEIKEFYDKIIKEDVWKVKKEKQGVKLKTTKLDGSPLKTAFSSLIYDHPYEEVKKFLAERDRTVNKSTPEDYRFGMKELEDFIKGDDWMIGYQIVKSPVKGVKNRHYATFTMNYEDEKTHSFYVISTSQNMEKYIQKTSDKMIDMELKKHVIHIYPSPDDPEKKCVFDMLVQCDPNGSIPHSVFNLAIRKQAEFGRGLLHIFELEKKKKGKK